MKVLCLTVERADANAVAAALPGMVASASATWAARFEDAAHWALANPDVSAVILDAQLGLEACGVFLSRLRRRGIGARAIVLLMTGLEPTASLGLDRHDVVMARAEFLLGLPETLADTLSGRPHIASAPLSSQVTLASRSVAAPPDLPAAPLPREPSPPAARAATSVPALPTDPTTSTAPVASDDRLSALEASLAKAERTRAAEIAAAEAQLARRTRAFAATVGDLLKARDASERQLKEVALERDHLRLQIASGTPDAQRLAETEAELQCASAAREGAERALAATEAQLSDSKAQAAEAAAARTRAEAERRAALETLAAAQRDATDAADRLARERELGAERLGCREAELSALLEQEIEKRLERETALTRNAAAERTVLEERATEAETLAARAHRNHAATVSDLHGLALDASTLEARLADLAHTNAELDARLAEAARARETRDAEVARDRLAATEQAARQQEHLAQLASGKSALEAQLAEAQTARATLDAQLTERQAAAAALEVQLADAQAARATLDAQLAEAEGVRLALQSEHAAALFTAAAEFAQQEAVREQQAAAAAALAADQLAQRDCALADLRANAEHARLEAISHADAAARRQDQLAAQLVETESARAALDVQLTERQVAVAALEARLADAQAARAALDGQLAEAEGIRLALQSEHAAALFTAAAEFAQREATREQQVAAAAALADDQLTQRDRALADLHAALDRQTDTAAQLRTELAQFRADAERARLEAINRADAAAHQQDQLAAQLTEAEGARAALDGRLLAREAAVSGLEVQLAEAERARQALQAEHAAERATLEGRAAAAQALTARARQDHSAALSDLHGVALESAAQEARLAELTRTNAELDGRLTEAARARETRDAEVASDRLAATEQAARQQEHLAQLASTTSALEAQLADAQAARATLDAQLAEAEGVRLALQSEHAAALFTAAAEFAQQEAVREQQAAAAAALAADQLTQRDRALADLHATLDRQTDTAAQLRTELAQLSAESAQFRADAERARLEVINRADAAARQQDQLAAQLAKAWRIQEALQAEHSATLSAAASEFAQREATREQHTARVEVSLREQLADAHVVRQALELQIEDLTARLAQSETNGRRLTDRMAAADAALLTAQHTMAEQEALLDVRLGRETELSGLLSAAAAAHHALDAQRLEAERARHAVEDRATQELAAAGEQLLDIETRLGDEQALRESVERERAALQQALEALRHDAARQIAEHAVTMAVQEAAAADSRTQIAALSARYAELEQSAEHAVARLRDDLQVAVAAHERDVEQLQNEQRGLAQQFDSVTKQRDAAREQAGQVPVLSNQLRDIRAQATRQFDEHPYPICRCTADGVPLRVNRAFADLLGCPPDDERTTVEYATAQFSSSGDVAWLAERCRAGASDRADCVWRALQGDRLTLRLHACATPDGFDLVVEDRTSLRALEDRLTRTKRLESVGRLAPEVTASCDRILEDVRREAIELIAALGSPMKAEQHVESILTEVARAHALLQRLDAFADEQMKALEPVDVRRVLRDLEPVLKEIAGDDVDVRLPKRPSRWAAALQVDVKTERLERVLVNAANFARARMPHGGTLAFELEETVVDQPFVDRYPSARIGRHALLTITETRQPIRGFASAGSGDAMRTGQADLGSARAGTPHRSEAIDDAAELAGTVSEANDESAPADQSGVDLAPLQDLVRTCGGHLWIEAAASGNMVLKIHLPLRTPEERRWPTFGLTAFRSSGY